MSDYPTWRADRLAELDAMQPKIDELPPTIRDLVQPYADTLRRHVGDLNLGGHAQSLGKYVEKATRRLGGGAGPDHGQARVRGVECTLDRLHVRPLAPHARQWHRAGQP